MISIVIPFYNEKENIPVLLREIHTSCVKENYQYEVILVDDGSSEKISISKTEFPHVHLYTHKKRMGKGEALRTGMRYAKGEICVFMDGDLQDDPSDLAKFMEKIESGADLVNGVRQRRSDTHLIKLYSFFANVVLHKFLHSPFTDINCGFKMFRKELLDEYPLYGNNFRFFPLSAYYRGYKVDEVTVHNRKRIHGSSKFGPMKIFVGILDMMTAYFVFLFADRPLHFFGSIGGVLFSVGFLISLYLTIERLFFNVLLYQRPLLQLGIVLIIVGIQVVMTGLIGELIVYFNKSRNK